jgi:hypothetical protein
MFQYREYGNLYIFRDDGEKVSEVEREAVEDWLAARPDLQYFDVAPLINVPHPLRIGTHDGLPRRVLLKITPSIH